MNIIFVISHLPDSRYKKRFEVLKPGNDVSAIYWNKRGNKEQPIVDIDIPSTGINIEANQTSPFKRIPQWFFYAKAALAELKKQAPDFIYVGNFDMLAIAWQYKKSHPSVRVIYEIADLHRYIADVPRNPARKIFRRMLIAAESNLMKIVDLLVITSREFYKSYYYQYITEEKVVFLPNMPRKEDFADYSKKQDGPFTVGFIGSIRYKEQLKMLIRAAKRADVKVIFAGAATDSEIEDLCKENADYCKFLGPFNYTRRIAQLYGMLDCVYSVYDADMANVRIALPNKLYEAILCELPIIVAKNTYLAKLTEQWGVGIAVSHKQEDELVDALLELKNNKARYDEICQNCRKNQYRVSLEKYNALLRDFIENK
ncbi:glycosyltransferase [Owariibacterium komagatae]|uniref:glycosyltransferase n=1 Tax=Owariibacterium komagatae TaxID=3136601 RepID=UPI0038B2883F